MRPVASFVLIVALALVDGLALAADGQKEETVAREYTRMAGTWALASGTRDGKPLPEAEVKQTRLIVAKNTFTVSGSIGTSGTGTFVVDPTKKPKTIDSTATDGPDKGKTSLGIYEISDDNATERACFAPPGKPRPKAFASKPGSGHLLQLWRKQ